jgi:hypothetical protein
MAEVYNPKRIQKLYSIWKMDYLYDNVETYDYLKTLFRAKNSGLSIFKLD